MSGGCMDDQPTPATIHAALLDALPEWRRHQRCTVGARCRAEHGEWADVLLEEYADAVGSQPTRH